MYSILHQNHEDRTATGAQIGPTVITFLLSLEITISNIYENTAQVLYGVYRQRITKSLKSPIRLFTLPSHLSTDYNPSKSILKITGSAPFYRTVASSFS